MIWIVLLALLFAPIGALAGFVRATGRIPEWLRKLLLRWAYRRMSDPWDRRIPPINDIPVYMLRWWVWRVRWFSSCYINNVLRSDDDRALHDHPWWNVSVVLLGGYWEYEPAWMGPVPGPYVPRRKAWRGPGSVVIRRKATWLHRLELDPNMKQETISLFFTGPATRRWGFRLPDTGEWIDARDWEAHLASTGQAPGMIGRTRDQFAENE